MLYTLLIYELKVRNYLFFIFTFSDYLYIIFKLPLHFLIHLRNFYSFCFYLGYHRFYDLYILIFGIIFDFFASLNNGGINKKDQRR